MKIGFSGHQNLPESARVNLTRVVSDLSEQCDEVEVCCSLAAGADQLVADLFLRLGATLDVVVPCYGYDYSFDFDDQRKEFVRLTKLATKVAILPYPSPGEFAFLAAGLVVAERSDLMLVAWDGKPSAGLGGTADIVKYAQSIGRSVRIAWPEGVER